MWFPLTNLSQLLTRKLHQIFLNFFFILKILRVDFLHFFFMIDGFDKRPFVPSKCTLLFFHTFRYTAFSMSTIKSIVNANDKILAAALKSFSDWKTQEQSRHKLGLPKTNFGWARRHYANRACARSITKNNPLFSSQTSYARGISIIQVIDKKIYWKSGDDPCWKQARKTPPTCPRNGAPVRVLFEHCKDAVYRYYLVMYLRLLYMLSVLP